MTDFNSSDGARGAGKKTQQPTGLADDDSVAPRSGLKAAKPSRGRSDRPYVKIAGPLLNWAIHGVALTVAVLVIVGIFQNLLGVVIGLYDADVTAGRKCVVEPIGSGWDQVLEVSTVFARHSLLYVMVRRTYHPTEKHVDCVY